MLKPYISSRTTVSPLISSSKPASTTSSTLTSHKCNPHAQLLSAMLSYFLKGNKSQPRMWQSTSRANFPFTNIKLALLSQQLMQEIFKIKKKLLMASRKNRVLKCSVLLRYFSKDLRTQAMDSHMGGCHHAINIFMNHRVQKSH